MKILASRKFLDICREVCINMGSGWLALSFYPLSITFSLESIALGLYNACLGLACLALAFTLMEDTYDL